jgi:hypothetical protein
LSCQHSRPLARRKRRDGAASEARQLTTRSTNPPTIFRTSPKTPPTASGVVDEGSPVLVPNASPRALITLATTAVHATGRQRTRGEGNLPWEPISKASSRPGTKSGTRPTPAASSRLRTGQQGGACVQRVIGVGGSGDHDATEDFTAHKMQPTGFSWRPDTTKPPTVGNVKSRRRKG